MPDELQIVLCEPVRVCEPLAHPPQHNPEMISVTAFVPDGLPLVGMNRQIRRDEFSDLLSEGRPFIHRERSSSGTMSAAVMAAIQIMSHVRIMDHSTCSRELSCRTISRRIPQEPSLQHGE